MTKEIQKKVPVDAVKSAEALRKDVNFRAVAMTGAGLTVLTIISLLIALLLFAQWTSSAKEGLQVSTPLQEGPHLPPTPRVQVSSRTDLKNLQELERAGLESYRWNRETGTFRIPIERAMEILAREDPLPARKEEPEGRR